MAWMLSPFLLLLYYLSAGSTQASNPQVVLNPDSRLIPVGAEALFTCKFRNVLSPYWEINGTKATNDFNKIHLMNQGFFIDQEWTNSDGIMVLTMRVNGSYPRLHNSRIQCKTFSQGIHSEIATLLTIDVPPLSSNPLLQQPNATSLRLMWSPPFLWSGYFIKSYNITVWSSSDGNVNFYQVNSTSFSDAVVAFPFSPHHQHCTNFTFGITPVHHQFANQTHYVTGGYLSAPGSFNVSAIALFRADGTPLVRALVKLSHKICSYQELSIAINITDRTTNTLVTRDGPIPHHGNNSFEYDITSSNLKREQEYLMTVIVNTGFESSSNLSSFNTSLDPDLYSTNPPCTPVTGKSGNGRNDHQFIYKVAMGACLGLAVLMLFTLVFVFLCFLVHRQRKISQGKALNISTNRMQNAMVHNPIYDGPVYESVQPHFDTLTASVKQDLSLSSISASNSPPGSSTPPNVGSTNNSQKMVRYLDQPIQPRTQSLSHPSTPDNNNPRSTCVCAQAATKVMGLKKNGKERNKLHLTLTLNGNEAANPAFGVPCRKEEEVVLGGDLPGNKRAVTSDGDENYTVMSPIKRKDGGNIGKVTELSPEDTDKYKEEVN